MAMLLSRLKKAKDEILHRDKDEKKKEEAETSSRSVRLRKKIRKPAKESNENALSTRQKKLKKKTEKDKREDRTKADDDGKDNSTRKKLIGLIMKRKKKHTVTEESPDDEEREKESRVQRMHDISERRPAHEKNVAEIVKAQLAAGAVDVSSEDVKTAMRNFALRTSSLLAPGALQEYAQSIKMYIPEDTTREAFDKNPTKNRYKDVLCADRERVVLNKGDSDYIHANHVRGAPLPESQHFICTQGPLPGTVADFWRMCRQELTSSIIMLCETKEQGKEKCCQYWSERDGDTMKIEGTEISVTTKGKFLHEGSGVTTTLLNVKEKGDSHDQWILHHQWKTWPDKGVPENFDNVLKLLQMIRKSDTKSSCVIHCSAGIGRTGTVVAVEMCLQRLLQGRPLEVLSVVKQLRAKRMHCVQTDLQYAFVYRVLIGFVSIRDPEPETKQVTEEFIKSYNSLIAARQQPTEAYAPVQFGPPS
ncbi:hypothetical protein QR680_009039 [Steinernema hermaphroditum]|uniref:Tyrosine-protein phosphatase domain-containing protein n=1 Tax=Steinernema hermaphroditum TaxID=289476 RepID=A0AA39IL56_9BILA|nr:hypothetical protein QR680_009039 [Steinernema hermaphroditum]